MNDKLTIGGAFGGPEAGAPGKPLGASERARLAVECHTDAVFRLLRRLGVDDADVDDGVQKVFTTFARRLDGVAAGSERSFLLGTAVHVAADYRRSRRRRRDDPTDLGDDLARPGDDAVAQDDLLDRKRRLELLNATLARLPADTREVFVLFELEELTLSEIAKVLEIPRGTAASRLRRGREQFEAICSALERVR